MSPESYPYNHTPSPEALQKGEIDIRRVDEHDYENISHLARKNFEGPSFSLFPKDVIQAYIAANSQADIKHAIGTEGTEAYVAENVQNEIVGFLLTRHNQVIRRNAYGDLDLRRLHVDPSAQGNGIGSKLFQILDNRARDLNVSHITTHASGGSRPFFEANGWEGTTTFNDMTKRGKTRALVFAAQKQITPQEIELFSTPTHIVYTGGNTRKAEYIHKIAADNTKSEFIAFSKAQENESTSDIMEAAESKAQSTARQIKGIGKFSPLIVAGDIRTDLVIINGNRNSFRYDFLNRGKPHGATTEDKLLEISDNFTELLITSEETEKPAPYIVRSATYILDPKDPENTLVSTNDASIWLTQEGLMELSTKEGVRRYREEALDRLDADIFDMSSGFCLPIFLERNYVAGINGHPIESLQKKEQAIDKALHTALIGIDGALIKRRLGIIE